MRFHTYTKFSPEMADAVDLQSLLDKLADFLLQSGFAGGKNQQPYYGWDFGEEGDRSMESLRQAILNALIESGQFTPEMLEALRGEGDEEGQAKLAKLLDELVQRLINEGYLSMDAPPQMPAGHQPLEGPGSVAKAASRDVQFNLTDKAPYEPLAPLGLDEALRRAYRDRPDYLSAVQQVLSAERLRSAATAEHLPTLDVSGNYGAAGVNIDSSKSAFLQTSAS